MSYDIASELLSLKPHRIDPSLNNKKFTFIGGPGTRKTTVASKFPDSLTVATERGYLFIDGIIVKDVADWNEVLSVMYALSTDDAVKERFKVINFDRADSMYEMAVRSVCRKLNIDDPGDLGYGKGWGAVGKAFREPVSMLERSGYGINFIVHDKDLYDDKMKKIGYSADLGKNATKTIVGLSDFVFHLRTEPLDAEDPGKGRTVYAYSQTTDIDTKSRARYLAPKFEFTYDNLVKELNTAIEKQVKIEGIETEIRGRKEIKPMSLEDLKSEVIELIKRAASTPEKSTVFRLIGEHFGNTKVSEASIEHYHSLALLKEYILSVLTTVL